MTDALVLDRQAEIQADGFGMSDVEVAVRLRRESRDDLGALAGFQISGDDVADEVGWGG
jgi:hypothetical protein